MLHFDCKIQKTSVLIMLPWIADVHFNEAADVMLLLNKEQQYCSLGIGLIFCTLQYLLTFFKISWSAEVGSELA
jgi:hypothetical protein